MKRGLGDSGRAEHLNVRLPPWIESHRAEHGPFRHGWRPGASGPLRRRRSDRLVGGIAAEIAARFRIDVTFVRVALVLVGLASGLGVAAYVVAWLVIPIEGESTSIASRALSDVRGIALAITLLPGLVLALLLASALHVGWLGSFAGSAFVAAAGLVLIWRNAEDDERRIIRHVAEPLVHLGVASRRSRRTLALRILAGFGLAVVGLVLVLGFHSRSVFRPLGGVGLVAAGLVVIFGPWWLTVARDLVEERQARVRAEERADMAARVHDSVLQTLALIQKNADQPQRVVQLARAQERELRSWLFDGRTGADDDETLVAAIRRLEAEVEAAHGVPVESVIVGDCPLDDDLRALVAAGREAAVNAAKWSGAPVISLYLEIEPTAISLFVRDRGIGFDQATVAPDRRGLAESIVGRMSRHGGSAVVTSRLGRGTEVELRVARRPTRPEPKGAGV